MAFTHGTPEWEENYVKLTKDRMASQTKPFLYFMPEWVGEWEKFLQNDAKYKEVAKDWEGSVVLLVQKNPDFGVTQDLYLFMDLWHGDCRSIRFVPDTAGKKGNYIISGTIERWMAVGKKQLDPVKGMMQGKLKLKGDLPTIVRAVKAALRLVETAADVGGKMPDEWTQENKDMVKTLIADLGSKFGIT